MLLCCSVPLAFVVCALSAVRDPGHSDEKALREAGVAADAKQLLEFFQRRTLSPKSGFSSSS